VVKEPESVDLAVARSRLLHIAGILRTRRWFCGFSVVLLIVRGVPPSQTKEKKEDLVKTVPGIWRP